VGLLLKSLDDADKADFQKVLSAKDLTSEALTDLDWLLKGSMASSAYGDNPVALVLH